MAIYITCLYMYMPTCTCIYMYMYMHTVHVYAYSTCICIQYMYIHVLIYMYRFESHPRQLIFSRKSDCLGCAVLLCLVCLLTLLASFFLPSHLSFKNMYCIHVCTCRYAIYFPGIHVFGELGLLCTFTPQTNYFHFVPSFRMTLNLNSNS